MIAAVLGLIPANIAKNKGHSFGLWWFYGWMLFIVAIIHVQFIDDYNAPQVSYMNRPPYNPPPYNPPPMANENVPYNAPSMSGNVQNTQTNTNKNTQASTQDAVEALKTYKELWDQGILTEEEFNAKKEQLLKLL